MINETVYQWFGLAAREAVIFEDPHQVLNGGETHPAGALSLLPVLLQQRLEARVVAEGVPDWIEADEGHRQITRD